MRDVEFPLQHITLRGWQQGEPGGPVILALHGWLDNANSFAPLAPFLQDFRLVAVDLPGHGYSEHRPQGAHYHLLDYVQDVHELILHNNWQQVILLGHSMGGIIGSLYCATFPERVTHFITIEALGPLCQEEETSPAQLRAAIESRLLVAAGEARSPKTFVDAVLARQKAGKVSAVAAELLVQRNLQQVSEHQFRWRTDRRLRTKSSLRLTPAQAEAFLRKIACPVMFIGGEQGFTSLGRLLQQRQPWLGDLQTGLVQGGHHLHMDNPQQVAELLKSFVAAKLKAG